MATYEVIGVPGTEDSRSSLTMASAQHNEDSQSPPSPLPPSPPSPQSSPPLPPQSPQSQDRSPSTVEGTDTCVPTTSLKIELVHEPAIQEPAIQEPEAQEPETQEPETQEPEIQEPEIQEPEIQVTDEPVDEPEDHHLNTSTRSGLTNPAPAPDSAVFQPTAHQQPAAPAAYSSGAHHNPSIAHPYYSIPPFFSPLVPPRPITIPPMQALNLNFSDSGYISPGRGQQPTGMAPSSQAVAATPGSGDVILRGQQTLGVPPSSLAMAATPGSGNLILRGQQALGVPPISLALAATPGSGDLSLRAQQALGVPPSSLAISGTPGSVHLPIRAPPMVPPLFGSPLAAHPLYCSTPYMTRVPLPVPVIQGNIPLDERARRERELTLMARAQLPSPQLPPMHPMMPFNMPFPTFPMYRPYPFMVVPPGQPIEQQQPLDLSSSDQSSSPRRIRKSLFPADSSHLPAAGMPPDPDGPPDCKRIKAEHVDQREEDRKNPFGINKILGVRNSPIKSEADSTNNEHNKGQDFNAQIRKSRKRTHSSSSAGVENAPPLAAEISPPATGENDPPPTKKKCRDRPPLWGSELPERIITFKDCPEKEQFCDSKGRYQVPDMPEDHEEQEKMCASLLRLFQNSDLPPVPRNLRDNVIGLRFYPRMQTVFQASLVYPSEDIMVSPFGLAFENFRAEEDNKVIDRMLKKQGAFYHCLGRKCIDPQEAQCSFTAKTLGKMRRHVKNHLPDKKWVCCFCRVQMTDQTDMARHGTTHTMLRPFFCDVCGKFFTQKVTLVNHLQTNHATKLKEESGKERFTCRQCGVHYTSSQRKECIEHLKTFHYKTHYASLRKRKRFPFSAEEGSS